MLAVTDLPKLNAVLNSLATVLLASGYLAIRARRITLHKSLMLSAFVTSTLFLISYLVYHYQALHTAFAGPEWLAPPYYAMLVTHIVLAVALVPMVLTTLFWASRDDFARHMRIARWTLPVWLYVSVTGVLIYVILYVIFPAPTAA